MSGLITATTTLGLFIGSAMGMSVSSLNIQQINKAEEVCVEHMGISRISTRPWNTSVAVRCLDGITVTAPVEY
jgi:hypothetical protein